MGLRRSHGPLDSQVRSECWELCVVRLFCARLLSLSESLAVPCCAVLCSPAEEVHRRTDQRGRVRVARGRCHAHRAWRRHQRPPPESGAHRCKARQATAQADALHGVVRQVPLRMDTRFSLHSFSYGWQKCCFQNAAVYAHLHPARRAAHKGVSVCGFVCVAHVCKLAGVRACARVRGCAGVRAGATVGWQVTCVCRRAAGR